MRGRMMHDSAPVIRLQHDMNRLFEGFFDGMPAQRGQPANYPGINLWEENDSAFCEMELPGVTMDDIDVLVSGREVTIKGERKIPDLQGATYHRRERNPGLFSRTVTLPWEIAADAVEAKLRDGVLSIRLPKSERSKPKKVKVVTT